MAIDQHLGPTWKSFHWQQGRPLLSLHCCALLCTLFLSILRTVSRSIDQAHVQHLLFNYCRVSCCWFLLTAAVLCYLITVTAAVFFFFIWVAVFSLSSLLIIHICSLLYFFSVDHPYPSSSCCCCLSTAFCCSVLLVAWIKLKNWIPLLFDLMAKTMCLGHFNSKYTLKEKNCGLILMALKRSQENSFLEN